MDTKASFPERRPPHPRANTCMIVFEWMLPVCHHAQVRSSWVGFAFKWTCTCYQFELMFFSDESLLGTQSDAYAAVSSAVLWSDRTACGKGTASVSVKYVLFIKVFMLGCWMHSGIVVFYGCNMEMTSKSFIFRNLDHDISWLVTWNLLYSSLNHFIYLFS